MSTFRHFRQLAWAALVVSPGFVTTACTPVTHGTVAKPSAAAELPQPPVQAVSVQTPSVPAPEEVSQGPWPWPFSEDDDALRELEDEFEGSGWTFWPS